MPEWMALRDWLLAPEGAADEAMSLEAEPAIAAEIEPVVDEAEDIEALLSEVRFFRAALAEAIDLRARALAEEIAVDVLARELRLSPADLSRVIQSACARYYSDAILAIRVHPDDVTLLSSYERVVPDTSLRRGDVLIELSDGTIDATLGVRLERVLRAVRS